MYDNWLKKQKPQPFQQPARPVIRQEPARPNEAQHVCRQGSQPPNQLQPPGSGKKEAADAEEVAKSVKNIVLLPLSAFEPTAAPLVTAEEPVILLPPSAFMFIIQCALSHEP